MFIQVLFICLLSNVLLTVSAENAYAEVFRPRLLSLDNYNEQLDKYWTPERLKGAKTLDITLPSLENKTTSGNGNVSTGPPSSVPGSLPSDNSAIIKAISATGRQVTTTGRVFWQTGESLWSCSASVVSSNSNDLIVTAGHCVYDTTEKEWFINNNWVFIPAYSNGNKPYGTWGARRMMVQQPWISSADYNYDVAFVALGTVNQKHIQTVVGSQGIGFNQPRSAYIYSFGYPVNIDSGDYLESCSGTTQQSQYTQSEYVGQALPCDMGHGCSGGPWLQNFNTATGIGYITSVNSFTITNVPNVMNGPYFGSNIESLYYEATFM